MKQQRKRTTYYLAALIIALAGIFLDQITKYLAVVHLKEKEAYVLWDQVFQLEYLEKSGRSIWDASESTDIFLFQRYFDQCSCRVVLSSRTDGKEISTVKIVCRFYYGRCIR
jgi:hypothetical protein